MTSPEPVRLVETKEPWDEAEYAAWERDQFREFQDPHLMIAAIVANMIAAAVFFYFIFHSLP